MSNSDEPQDLTQLPKNSAPKEESWGFFGFTFGLSRRPTKTECIMIAKYITALLIGGVIHEWDIFHDLLTSKMSKMAEYVGVAIIGVTGFLLFRTLDRKGLLKESYERRDDSWTDDSLD